MLSLLFAGEGFDVAAAPAACRVPPLGLLESLPEAVRERALAWELHVREVETGHPSGSGAVAPGAEYDPDVRTLAQREEAKAAELSAAGMTTSAVTVRRMQARYRDGGMRALVDQRAARPRPAPGHADERVVAALREVVEAGQERSSKTLGRLRVYTERLLAQRHGPGGRCRCRRPRRSTGSSTPSPTGAGCWTVRSTAAGGAAGQQRRWRSAWPAPPFIPTTVMAPGELMRDSTVLDTFVVLDDGVVERPGPTIALDVTTRSNCAAVLRPKGTRSADTAQLLAQMMVPAPMRPRLGRGAGDGTPSDCGPPLADTRTSPDQPVRARGLFQARCYRSNSRCSMSVKRTSSSWPARRPPSWKYTSLNPSAAISWSRCSVAPASWASKRRAA